MDDEERHKIAKKRVEARFGFYIHAAVFIAVNLLLIAINLINSPGVLWFIWPLFGWGIGLAFHGASVFLSPNIRAAKEKMVKKELEKMH